MLPELCLGLVRKAVADRRERVDKLIERGVLADVDEVLDSSTHNPLPGPRGLNYLSPELRRNY